MADIGWKADTDMLSTPPVRIPTGRQPDGKRTFLRRRVRKQRAGRLRCLVEQRPKKSRYFRGLPPPPRYRPALSLRAQSETTTNSNLGFESRSVRQRGGKLPLRAR